VCDVGVVYRCTPSTLLSDDCVWSEVCGVGVVCRCTSSTLLSDDCVWSEVCGAGVVYRCTSSTLPQSDVCVWSEVCGVGVVCRCTSSTLLRVTPTMRCRPTSTESWIGFCQSVTDTARRLKTFRHLQTTTSVQVAAACVL